MPGYDGTGPEGTGPIGRGLGPCGEGNNYPRRTFWGGRGGGRRRWFRSFRRPSYFPENERNSLDAEKRWLTQQLEAIDKRLKDVKEE